MVVAPGESWRARASRVYGLTSARAFGPAVWTLTFGQVISLLGRAAVVPFIIIYLTKVVGISLTFIGVGVLLEQTVRALAGPLAGWASDRVGRKPVMLFGLIGVGLAVPGYALVSGPASYLLVSSTVGLFESTYFPSARAYLADIVPPNRRAAVYGLNHVGLNLGWVLGLSTGALLFAATGSYTPLFLLGGLAPLAFALYVAIVIHEPTRAERDRAAGGHANTPRGNPFRDFGKLLASRPFARFLVLSAGFYLAFGMFNIVLPLFVTDGLGLPPSAVAVPFLINTIMIVLVQLPLGTLSDRVDRIRVLAFSALALVTGYMFFAASGAFLAWGFVVYVPLALGAVAITVGEMLFAPSLGAVASELAPPGLTGSAMGVMAFANAAAQAASPVLTDRIAGPHGWAWLWTTFAALTFASSLGLLLMRRGLKDAAAENAIPATVTS
ncbi:MAG: MFS transporter [Thermoplasmatota archaeon]